MLPCPPPDFAPRAPSLKLPPLACDCHAHVFGPAARYPFAAERRYTPPDCLYADFRRMLGALGVERAVIVQPSVYGTDNAATLAALRADPQRLRGVAVVPPDADCAVLEPLHAAGVRGVRINIADSGNARGALPLAELRALAQRIRALRWHMEFLLHADEYPDLDRQLAGFPVPVVFGHIGYLTQGKGPDDPGFRALLALVRAGRAWVKLSGPYRLSSGALPYADVTPFAHALLEANPGRVVWGTDWPHVMLRGRMPNDGELADLLSDWIPDEALRRRVLAENPAELYDF